MQTGLGTLPNSISSVFSQGAIMSSAEATNVSMEGSGFFIVGDTGEDRFYTRAGNFFLDDAGFLVNPDGKYVLGYTQRDANNEIISSGALNPISLPGNSLSGPEASTFFEIYSNLDADAAVGDTYTASVTVYDSLGASHTLSIVFENTAPGTWDIDTAANPVTISDGTVTGISATQLVFDGTGTLTTPAAGTNIDIDFTFTNGADPQTVTWQLWDQDTGTIPLITGYAQDSTTYSTNSDGYPPGFLTTVIVDQEGMIQGVFSNGQVEDMAQLAIANFNNPKGLLRTGRNLFTETGASGTPSIGAANSGGRGTVVGSALESSNVDIAVEFTKMLVFERGYQANSKIITASDTITQTAISLVR
jgi:flagellar hook protein FlgE